MSAPEHLLVVVTNFTENHGGVQAHLEHLCPRLVERGIRVTVAYLGERPEAYEVDGGVIALPLHRRFDLKNVIALPGFGQWRKFARDARAGLLDRGPVTHVATHTRFFPMSTLGVRLAHKLRVPVVHTEHGAGSVVTGSKVIVLGSRVIDATLGRWSLRHADAVVSVSNDTAAFVRDLAKVGSTVIPNGIDVSAWTPRAGETVPDVRPLVFVGRLVAEKGWRDFLDVAAAVRKATGTDRPIHVIGDGDDADAARLHAARLELEGVVWHGRLDAADIRDLLRGSVYVNPSVAAEGFQLTQLEALVAGAAVVTYEVGVARELAESGVGDVTVVPSADAAALAAAAIAAAGRPALLPTADDVARWDWETVADRYAEVLRATPARRR